MHKLRAAWRPCRLRCAVQIRRVPQRAYALLRMTSQDDIVDEGVRRGGLLCFQDVRQEIWLRLVADQMGIHFSAVILEFVGRVVVGVLDQKFDRV